MTTEEMISGFSIKYLHINGNEMETITEMKNSEYEIFNNIFTETLSGIVSGSNVINVLFETSTLYKESSSSLSFTPLKISGPNDYTMTWDTPIAFNNSNLTGYSSKGLLIPFVHVN